MYFALNEEEDRDAACKFINLFGTGDERGAAQTRKELEKEVKVHRKMMHASILEFIDVELVEPNPLYADGLFILLELAINGDLFDKIGSSSASSLDGIVLTTRFPSQLLMLASRTISPTSISTSSCSASCVHPLPPDARRPLTSPSRSIFIPKASLIAISSRKTFFWTLQVRSSSCAALILSLTTSPPYQET